VSFCFAQLRGYPSNFGSLGILIVLYSVGAHLARRRRTVAAAASLAYVALAISLHALHSPERPVDYVTFYLVLAGCWAVGAWMRARARAQDERRRLEASAAVASDRVQIARELHDVVTHHVTAMVVQADAAQFLVADSPERVTETLGSIGSSGRTALAELRFLLGALNGPGDFEATGRRSREARRIGELVEQTRQAGQPVEFSEYGDPRPASGGAELTAYRIVQEALTNALKHAAGMPTAVSVHHSEDEITIEVTTRGHRPRGLLGNSAKASSLSRSGGGRGLIGLRERAAVFGGELHADAQVDGGFAVRARLPLHEPS
jgi:signal transduction histidine kinase